MAGRDEQGPPRVLGLTGPIACGKTTVGDILLGLGALERIDADRIVHTLMTPGAPVTHAVARAFGPNVLASDGSVDRARLAAIVFDDPARLAELESIVHPAVRERIRARLAELANRPGVVIVDAVKLLQSDLLALCDAVWVVRCNPAVQLERLTGPRGLNAAAAQGRLAAQPSFEHPAITAVIENSGSREALRATVAQRWDELFSLDVRENLTR